MLTITCSPTPGDEYGKRFYVPGVILVSVCPQCGEAVTMNLGEHYLSCPVANKPFDITFCHEADLSEPYWCHEWTERIVLRITIEAAKAAGGNDEH